MPVETRSSTNVFESMFHAVSSAVDNAAKVLGEEWRTMAPETKKKFQDIEAADRARYESEMEKYNSPAVKAVCPFASVQRVSRRAVC